MGYIHNYKLNKKNASGITPISLCLLGRNKIQNFCLSFILLLTFFSCKKTFLDVEDKSVILAEQYVRDLSTTEQYMNGVYDILRRQLYRASFIDPQIYSEFVADNVKPSISGSTALGTSTISFYNWNQSLPSNYLNSVWITGYNLARSTSFVIDKARSFKDEDVSKSNQLIAQALSIRAYVHFLIVNCYAQSFNYSTAGDHPGVPYIKDYDWTKPVIRNSVSSVYTAMIKDLSEAISLFSDDVSNKLVMNKAAAKALLARIYLFKEDWQNAKEIAKEVLAIVPIMTNTPTHKIYPDSLFHKGESEALFQLEPRSSLIHGGSSSFNTAFPGSVFRRTGTNGTSPAMLLATGDIANLLNQNVKDIRRVWIKSAGGSDSIIKFPSNIIPGFSNSYQSYYNTLLRSSEMVLIVAEAAAELGDNNTAQIYVDMIRQRADPTLPNSTSIGSVLIELIRLERRKELCFEGFRMFDLLRWKQPVNRMDVAIGSPNSLPYPNDKAIAPIPAIDVVNGIQQNPGY